MWRTSTSRPTPAPETWWSLRMCPWPRCWYRRMSRCWTRAARSTRRRLLGSVYRCGTSWSRLEWRGLSPAGRRRTTYGRSKPSLRRWIGSSRAWGVPDDAGHAARRGPGVEASGGAFTPGAIVALAERNPRNTSTIEGPERRSRCCSVAGPSSVRKQVWYGSVHGPHRALKPEGHSECGGAGHHFRPEPRSAVLEWKVRVAQCRRYRPERAPCAHLRHRAEGYRPGQ